MSQEGKKGKSKSNPFFNKGGSLLNEAETQELPGGMQQGHSTPDYAARKAEADRREAGLAAGATGIRVPQGHTVSDYETRKAEANRLEAERTAGASGLDVPQGHTVPDYIERKAEADRLQAEAASGAEGISGGGMEGAGSIAGAGDPAGTPGGSAAGMAGVAGAAVSAAGSLRPDRTDTTTIPEGGFPDAGLTGDGLAGFADGTAPAAGMGSPFPEGVGFTYDGSIPSDSGADAMETESFLNANDFQNGYGNGGLDPNSNGGYGSGNPGAWGAGGYDGFDGYGPGGDTATVTKKSPLVPILIGVILLTLLVAAILGIKIYQTHQKEQDDKAAADKVIEQIDTLAPDEYSIETLETDEQTVKDARASYEDLTSDQKDYVDNKPKLKKAEDRILGLKEEKAREQAAENDRLQEELNAKQSSGSTAAPAASSRSYKYTAVSPYLAYVNHPAGSSLYLRQGPGKGYRTITAMPNGSEVIVLGKSGKWLYVEYYSYLSGRFYEGFASGKYIKSAPPKTYERDIDRGYTPVSQSYPAWVNTNADPLSMRTGPGTNYREIMQIPRAAKVTVLGTSGSWTYVRYEGNEGYVKGEYLTRSQVSEYSRVSEHSEWTTSSLQMRTGPSKSYKVVKTLDKGDEVTVIGEQAGWYYVIAKDSGREGFVSGKYLTRTNPNGDKEEPEPEPEPETEMDPDDTPDIDGEDSNSDSDVSTDEDPSGEPDDPDSGSDDSDDGNDTDHSDSSDSEPDTPSENEDSGGDSGEDVEEQ